MRGDRRVSAAAVREALRSAASVAAAARALGCSRALVYQRAQEDGEAAKALEDLKLRRGAKAPGGRAEVPTIPPGLEGDPDVQIALETLRDVAKEGGKGDGPRVAAARELLRHAVGRIERERAEDAGAGQTKAPPPPEPLTAEDVAAALRFAQ